MKIRINKALLRKIINEEIIREEKGINLEIEQFSENAYDIIVDYINRLPQIIGQRMDELNGAPPTEDTFTIKDIDLGTLNDKDVSLNLKYVQKNNGALAWYTPFIGRLYMFIDDDILNNGLDKTLYECNDT